jgi:hypothetical protein
MADDGSTRNSSSIALSSSHVVVGCVYGRRHRQLRFFMPVRTAFGGADRAVDHQTSARTIRCPCFIGSISSEAGRTISDFLRPRCASYSIPVPFSESQTEIEIRG